MNVERVRNIMAGFVENVGYAMVDGDDMWPKGQCLGTCLLLVPLLRASEGSSVSFKLVVGTAGEARTAHAWIHASNMQPDDIAFEFAVDPTVSQFDFWQELGEPDDYAIWDPFGIEEHCYIERRTLKSDEEDDLRRRTHVSRNIVTSSIHTPGAREIFDNYREPRPTYEPLCASEEERRELIRRGIENAVDDECSRAFRPAE